MKLSQFADDITLYNADIESLRMALKVVWDFERIAGLVVEMEK